MKKLFIISLLIVLLTGCAASNTSDNDSTTKDETITFTDDSISTSTIDGIQIDGTKLTINSAGTYTVSGTCSNGSITIDASDVTLILDNLDLTSTEGAPIICKKNSEVTLVATNENSLSDTSSNNDETNSEADNAVIKCKDNSVVTLAGDGVLNINALGKNGIKVKGEESILNIENLTLNITANVNDAINVEGTLNLISGNVTISAGDDALHSDLILNVGSDNTNPIINIKSCYEGIEGATVNIYSGDITINASDDCINGANSELTSYDFSINIYGGTIDAYTSDGDGFDSNGDLNIAGGTIKVISANRADNEPLDADGTINITGGIILAAGGSSGMGANINTTQACLIFNQVNINNSFSIIDDTNTICETDVDCDITYNFYSSAELNTNDTYTLESNQASITATAQTGIVQTGNGMQMPQDMPNGMEKPDGNMPMDRPNDNFRREAN